MSRITHRRVVLLLGVCAELVAASSVAADEVTGTFEALVPTQISQWRAESGFSLSMRSDYVESNSRSTRFATMAATAQIRLRSATRRYSLGLLTEHAVMQDRDDSTLIAGVLGYTAQRWSFTFAPYIKKASGVTEWRQQSTARYRLTQRSSIGLELAGPLSTGPGSRLLLGYYGKLTDTTTIALTGGSRVGPSGPDVALRVALTWKVR